MNSMNKENIKNNQKKINGILIAIPITLMLSIFLNNQEKEIFPSWLHYVTTFISASLVSFSMYLISQKNFVGCNCNHKGNK